jgi:type I restriction enzyme, S subunit
VSLTISPARIVEESGSPLLVAPEGWPRRPLGEVAEILNGFAFRSKQFVPDGGVPLIRIRDIFNTETAVGYAGDYEQRYLVRKGELLVGMDGDFNCARWAGPDALLNQRVCKIAPDPDVLDIDYLTAVLPAYLQAIHDLTSSTTVTHLSSRDVAQIPLPVPSLAEQRALAVATGAAASSTSSAISHLSTARRAIERFRQAVRAAACSGRLTAAWRAENGRTESAAALLERMQSERRSLWRERNAHRTYREPLPLSDDDLSEIPFLRSQNVRQRGFDSDGLVHIPADFHGALRKSRLAGGEILVTRSGANTGDCCVFPRGIGEANCADLVITRPLSGLVPEYGAIYVSSPTGRARLSLKETGIAQPHFNIGAMRVKAFPLPPLAEQREIVDQVSRLLAAADAVAARIHLASQRVERSSHPVLAKAFRGELIGAASPAV